MKRTLFTLLLLLPFLFAITDAQSFFEEDFESAQLPANWTQTTQASDGGWLVGTANGLSSQFWEIADNGSRIVATNDDGCNCDKSEDRLITPSIIIPDQVTVLLEFDVFFGEGFYAGVSESASVDISLDDGNTWSTLYTINGSNEWQHLFVDLTQYANSNVKLGFTYRDNGGWLFGMALDNVVVTTPPLRDIEMVSLNVRSFAEQGDTIAIEGELLNKASRDIESLEINYSLNGNPAVTQTVSGLQIPAFTSGNYAHPIPWVPDASGVNTLEVWISQINGGPDSDESNNQLETEIEVFPEVVIPNKMDDFLGADPEITLIGDASDELDKPTDLDFFPILGKNELWVINERVENTGGSTVTYFDVGTDEQSSWQRVDGNAWHFMSLPTALEFSSDNFNFASAPGVFDANHNGGAPFTGPTLWSSDPEIYAQPSGGNGSHLDMLHGSPHSMGIAHEVDNVFWIFDGYHEHIVRYDFVDDHGPGNDYHGDAIVRRYTEIEVKRDAPVPSHMVLDKETGWLYVVDNGNDRVLRLDINSGNVANTLDLINEQLAEHSEVLNVDWEVIIDTGLVRPCGIDLIENRLIVGEYNSGEIIVYDMDAEFRELGRLSVSSPGLTGLKIGPEGNIWFTNRLENTLSMAEPGIIISVNDPHPSFTASINPNPATEILQWYLGNVKITNEIIIKLFDPLGRCVEQMRTYDQQGVLNVSQQPSGIYTLEVTVGNEKLAKRVVIAR